MAKRKTEESETTKEKQPVKKVAIPSVIGIVPSDNPKKVINMNINAGMRFLCRKGMKTNVVYKLAEGQPFTFKADTCTLVHESGQEIPFLTSPKKRCSNC